MYEHKHFLPPAIITTISGTYIVPGWTPVPADTRLSDIKHIKPVVKKPDVHEVTGSKGAKYQVTVRPNRMNCTCPAGKFRGKCKHIEIIKKKLQKDLVA